MKFFKILFIIHLSVVLNACVGNVDFNQATDIVLSPEFKVALVHFRATPTNFIDPVTNDTVNFISDITEIHPFDNNTVRENINRIVLKFEIENTFNKAFNLEYRFLDALNQITFTVTFQVASNSNSVIAPIEIIDEELQSFLNSNRVRVFANMLSDTEPITQNMFLDYKSSADVFFNINANGN